MVPVPQQRHYSSSEESPPRKRASSARRLSRRARRNLEVDDIDELFFGGGDRSTSLGDKEDSDRNMSGLTPTKHHKRVDSHGPRLAKKPTMTSDSDAMIDQMHDHVPGAQKLKSKQQPASSNSESDQSIRSPMKTKKLKTNKHKPASKTNEKEEAAKAGAELERLELEGKPTPKFKVGDLVMVFDTHHPPPHRIDRGYIKAREYRGAGAEGNTGQTNANRCGEADTWRYQITAFPLHFELPKEDNKNINVARTELALARKAKPKTYWGGYNGGNKKDWEEYDDWSFGFGQWFEECEVECVEEVEGWKTTFEGYALIKCKADPEKKKKGKGKKVEMEEGSDGQGDEEMVEF